MLFTMLIKLDGWNRTKWNLCCNFHFTISFQNSNIKINSDKSLEILRWYKKEKEKGGCYKIWIINYREYSYN